MVLRITITVIMASPLKSGYVSMTYVMQMVTVTHVAADSTNAANASPNPVRREQFRGCPEVTLLEGAPTMDIMCSADPPQIESERICNDWE